METEAERLPAAIHATALVLGEAGILIRGPSGAGKSALARALIAAGRQNRLFARLVGDDRILLLEAGGRLIARPHPAISGLIEARGRGILAISHEPAAELHGVVDLVFAETGSALLPRMQEKHHMLARFGAIVLPRIALPAATPTASAAVAVLDFGHTLQPAFAK